jgi:hypothetical protein
MSAWACPVCGSGSWRAVAGGRSCLRCELLARQPQAPATAAPAACAVRPDPGPRTRLWLRSCSSPADAAADLQRGRSLRGWGTAGSCWRCWSETEPGVLDPDRGWDEDEVVDVLGLEPVPGLERSPGVAWCGHAGTAYAAYLPGLCALAGDLGPGDVEDAVARAVAAAAYRNDFLALYEGEDAGELDPDEGYELFRPTRLVWVRPWGTTKEDAAMDMDAATVIGSGTTRCPVCGAVALLWAAYGYDGHVAACTGSCDECGALVDEMDVPQPPEDEEDCPA